MKRSGPLPAKRKRPRTTKTAPCTAQRCGKPQLIDGLCAGHVKSTCDDIARALNRLTGDACTACGNNAVRLDWSHHITRQQMHTRWEPLNATLHCRPCHMRFTHHDALHVEWITYFIGPARYALLLDRAYGPRNPLTGQREAPKWRTSDLLDWYDRLRQEAA